MLYTFQYPPVLILGCGRSGTSIFGELFEGLGEYTYQSEPDFAALLYAFGFAKAAKVPKESTQYPPDAGLSFPLDTLLKSHPETKFFWIVRHPLDAICSLRAGIGSGWRHHPRPHDWRQWQHRSLVEKCAHHWSFINSVGYHRVREVAVIVYFEDMIRSPELFARSICTHLELPFSRHSGAIKRWADRIQNTNNDNFVEAETSKNHSRNDHSVRIERWRENLHPLQVDQVKRIVASTGQQFGYHLR